MAHTSTKPAIDYQNIFESAPFGYLILDSMYRVVTANTYFSQTIADHSSYNKNHLSSLIGEKKWHEMKKYIDNAVQGKTTPQAMILKNETGTNSSYLLSFHGIVSGKKYTYVGIVFEDITYQKYLEAEWRRSTEELKVILNHSASGIAVYNRNREVILINKTLYKMFDWPDTLRKKRNAHTRDDLVRILDEEFIFTDEYNNPFPAHDLPGSHAYKGEAEPERLFKATKKNTNIHRWYHMKARPVFDNAHNIDMVIIITHDITIQKEIEERKDEFISLASHELKTPITTQLALIQLIQSRLKKNEYDKLNEYTDKMSRQIRKQIDLIDNLLDISRIRAGKIVYSLDDVPVQQIIEEIAGDFQINHPEYSISIEGKTSSLIRADRFRVSQVLLNLLNNAAKHASQSKNIQILLSQKDTMMVVGVKDFGPGIPQEKIKSLFNRFYRSEQKFENTSGLGLGLYISYTIIHDHKGNLWVESKVGEGSTFYFSVPLVDNA